MHSTHRPPDPVYFGDYPASMRKAMGAALPAFTPEESAMLKGSMDYFAVNFYCETAPAAVRHWQLHVPCLPPAMSAWGSSAATHTAPHPST